MEEFKTIPTTWTLKAPRFIKVFHKVGKKKVDVKKYQMKNYSQENPRVTERP